MCIVSSSWHYEYLYGLGGIRIQKEVSSLLYFTPCFQTEIVFAVAIK
jgi:hypothetical protein